MAAAAPTCARRGETRREPELDPRVRSEPGRFLLPGTGNTAAACSGLLTQWGEKKHDVLFPPGFEPGTFRV